MTKSERMKLQVEHHGAFRLRKKESLARKRKVKAEMFAILFEAGYSLQDISFLNGISRERARQLVEKGKKTLKPLIPLEHMDNDVSSLTSK